MAKDTTRLTHADYVYGVASRNARLHAAAISCPPGAATRKDRRANMAAFRATQLAEAAHQDRISAARAAFLAPVERKPVPAHFLAAPLPSRTEAVALTMPVTRCPTRGRR